MHEKTQGSGKKLKDLAKNSSIWRKKTQGFAKKLNASESSDSV